ncbi:hypothetical protein BDZ94DRAFT_275572 [Collybia nuda]|uniref:Uncharacterized protein n=1 Tax=Collybia nuda TaxID=64659 RepID=A0A9P6CH73_9AGAR|nr:hypothetical protein BDZ94DRAFT_275572 [Collybia nuda]
MVMRLFNQIFLPDQVEIVNGLAAVVVVEALLYGIHLVLYFLCVFILIKHRKKSQLFILSAITIMFALTTADVAISFRFLLHDIPRVIKHEMNILMALLRAYPKTPFFITNNFLADSLWVYRCYIVWGKKKYILIGSAILLVVDTVLGYYNAGGSIFSFRGIATPLFLWTTLVVNIIMTCVTAGRIWWATRTVRPLLSKQAVQRYTIAVTVLIESGAIYSASLMLFLLTPPHNYSVLLEIFPIRLVGIMPLLMIVQVELGKGVNFEEFEKTSRSSLAGNSRLEYSMKNLGASEALPRTLRTEIQLTTVTNKYQDTPGTRLYSHVSMEPPPNAQSTSKRYHW